jgi:putative DNA methylase
MRGWYSRGYLPHFDAPYAPQIVTFRLADSLPAAKLEQWREELRRLPTAALEAGLRRRIEHYLDQGHGSAALRRPDIAQVVEETLLRCDGERYALHAWVIMPNHVHALLTVAEDDELAKVLHSWKSFTASAANRLLGRRGTFWQREYRDRFIRDARHYEAALGYIERNPVKARLCARPEDWPCGSARLRVAEANAQD